MDGGAEGKMAFFPVDSEDSQGAISFAPVFNPSGVGVLSLVCRRHELHAFKH